MSDNRGNNYDSKATVIVPKSGSNDKATVILPKDGGGGSPRPGGGRLPPTQVVGPDGLLLPLPPQAPAESGGGYGSQDATMPYSDAKGRPPNPGQTNARPGHAAHTRILTPDNTTPPAASTPGAHAAPAAGAASSFNPVIGWLVVIAGPGRGEFRPIRYGNNSIGRDGTQHISLDFGDLAISAEQQAYIRYQPEGRRFWLMPNNAKTNAVTHNADQPMAPVVLAPFDVIGMGVTRLRFMPLCGADFEWSDHPAT